MPTYFKDFKTGKFGWGYYIPTDMSQEKALEYFENLKSLVRDYNVQKKLQDDAETHSLSFNQIRLLNDMVEAIESAEVATTNTVFKNNLDKYLTELEDAVEADEVFEFLIKTYEQAKQFQKRNTAWNYSILNSLIITKSDPLATLSGPEAYWAGRNYRVKEEFKSQPIIITMPIKEGGENRKKDLYDKAMWFKNHSDDFAQFKEENGISQITTFDEYVKQNGFYQLAKYASLKIDYFKQKKFRRFEDAPTFTDTMVEPIPGKEVEPIGGDLQIPETGITNLEQKQKLSVLFDAMFKIAEKENVSTIGIGRAKDNINDFGRLLNAIALGRITKKLEFKLKDKLKQNETLEMFKAYAEIISHIVKKHYGLPSESSKYNIARFGGDRETIRKESDVLINMADALINEIDSYLGSNNTPALNEMRKIIKTMILKNFIK
jgi:hypothetical protein